MLSYYENYFEARKKFSPWHLCKHLCRWSDGTVYVSKKEIISNKDDARLFFIVLHHDYKWRFDDFENSTMYFDVVGDVVKGGVYNTLTHEKKTQCTVISCEPNEIVHHYNYPVDYFTKVCEAIRNA